MTKTLKVAIVCDWLDGIGGAEQVVRAFHRQYPDAPIYTSTYRPQNIDWFSNADVRTGWLNIFPTKLRKFLSPLRYLYFDHLDLRQYDLILSSSGAEAKGVKTRADATHICYLHAPTQYYWQKYDDYLKNPGFGPLDPLARLGLKLLVSPLRRIDYKFAQRPDHIITASSYVQGEIKKYYHRTSTIIFPPVNTEKFRCRSKNRNGFVTIGRQVPWKRVDLAIAACIKTKQQLTVIGDGSEHEDLVRQAQAHQNLITFLPTTDSAGVRRALSQARGFIFPSLEPFGIAPVESLATGTPVIAYGAGGALDYIIDGQNGILFPSQSVKSLSTAIKKFNQSTFDHRAITRSANKFSEKIFTTKTQAFINHHLKTD